MLAGLSSFNAAHSPVADEPAPRLQERPDQMLTINADQADYWGKSASGAKWITLEDKLDAALQPALDLVLDRAGLTAGMRVLDIGCGTGASVVQAAQRVGPSGRVVGLDISQPFLDRAAQRARALGLSNTRFVLADAQTHPFEKGGYDAIISRFGVMFFENTTAAFENMAHALAPGASMTFAAWGPLDGNAWFRDPFLAAVDRLGRPPKSDRNAPGPLAFHDRDRVVSLFADAGLSADADAVSLDLTPAGGVEGAAELCTKVGSVSRTMDYFNGTAEDETAIQSAIAKVFRAYDTPEGVRLPAVINLYRAARPA